MLNAVRILYVEDEDETRLLVAGKLEREGFQVTSVAKKDRGFDLLATGKEYDLFLLDLDLKDGTSDYYTIISDFKDKDPHTPIFVLSGTDPREAAAQSLRAGAVDFMRKDEFYSTVELATRIRLRANRQHIFEFWDDDDDADKGCWRVDPVVRSVKHPDGSLKDIPSASLNLLIVFLTTANQHLTGENPGLTEKDLPRGRTPLSQRIYNMRKVIGEDKIQTYRDRSDSRGQDYTIHRYRFLRRVRIKYLLHGD